MKLSKTSLIKLAPILIVFAAVLWGLDGVIRRSLYTLPPSIIVFYEHLVGLLIIAPFINWFRQKKRFSRQEVLALVWIGLVSGLLGTLWFTRALVLTEFIPFSVVFLLQKLQPIFAVAMAVVILKERISTKYFLWAGVALVAGYFLTFPQGKVDFVTNANHLLAALLAVGAAIAWGSSTAVSRYVLLRHDHSLVTGIRFLLTSIFTLIYILVSGQQNALFLPTLNNLYLIVLIALSTGMVAIWLYYQGLKHVEAKIATILELALPVTAIMIDIFWFKTHLLPLQYLAALIMVIAVYQVSRIRQK